MFTWTIKAYQTRFFLMKNERVLFAGPWVGEFGWELFCWQAYIRSLSKFYDKTICISNNHSKFLYDDFCDRFIEFSCNIEPNFIK